MAFNQVVKKAYAGGALSAFTAPLAAYKGSVIALNGVTTGNITSTAGLVLPMSATFTNVEWESLAAIVQFGITTTALVVKGIWQVSNDGTNWLQVFDINGTAPAQIAATGTGSLVTTQVVQHMTGVNMGFPYVRFAVLSTGATGAAGDNVTVAYNYRMRWSAA